MITIGIVAGEISGDSLGADFMQKMYAINANVRFVGVGGACMQALGLHSIIDIKRLSVMGIGEVVRHLPDLWHAKREILAYFYQQKIDLFIGIDLPDFNLRLGKQLKQRHIFCVQYVSPSIWAWRENRIHTIKKSCHLVLCLFPFELNVYHKHNHLAVCVGHPLIDKLYTIGKQRSNSPIIQQEQHFLNTLTVSAIDFNKPVIALLAGSRVGEIRRMLPLLLDAFGEFKKSCPDALALLAVADTAQLPIIEPMISTHRHQSDIHVLAGETTSPNGLSISQSVMMISQVTALSSGTATFEALLLNSPMVVIYQVAPLTYHIAKRLLYIDYVALPNILNQHISPHTKPVVCELLQQHANATNIAQQIDQLLQQPVQFHALNDKIHQLSQHNCADVVLSHFVQHKQLTNSR